MNPEIYFVGGSKGGVGKSATSIALIDALVASGKEILLVESATSNPDVYKMHHEEVTSVTLDLDDANGWIDLINVCDEHKDKVVVINTAARNNKGVSAYAETLSSTLKELDRELITLWVINRQRDSLELLSEYMDSLPSSKVHVIRNSHWGEESKFELYNGSNIRKTVESKDGLSLTLPDLADRVSDDLYSKRMSVAKGLLNLPMGNRAELTRWRNESRRMFKAIIDV